MNYLSNIELFFSPPENFSKNIVKISGEEFNHVVKVMRHSIKDEIHITDGIGKIYKAEISVIKIDFFEAEIKEHFSYINKFQNIAFCISNLKNSERLEFALEKSVELGITNFIVFNSKRTIAKGFKPDRLEKILLSAMKQSLRSFKPQIKSMSFEEIKNSKGRKIILEQNTKKKISDFKFQNNEEYYFIFGPEGGFDEDEIISFKDADLYSLSENRLRSETAVIKTASILSEIIY